MAKTPQLPKLPGQRRWNLAIERRPSTLYKENYNLLPTTENPAREKLFMPTPAGDPAKSRTPSLKSASIPSHWSGH